MDCGQTCLGMKEQCDMFQFKEVCWRPSGSEKCVKGLAGSGRSSMGGKTKGTCSLARIEKGKMSAVPMAWKSVCISGIFILNSKFLKNLTVYSLTC